MDLKFDDFAGDFLKVKANRSALRRASALSVSVQGLSDGVGTESWLGFGLDKRGGRYYNVIMEGSSHESTDSQDRKLTGHPDSQAFDSSSRPGGRGGVGG